MGRFNETNKLEKYKQQQYLICLLDFIKFTAELHLQASAEEITIQFAFISCFVYLSNYTIYLRLLSLGNETLKPLTRSSWNFLYIYVFVCIRIHRSCLPMEITCHSVEIVHFILFSSPVLFYLFRLIEFVQVL